MENGGRTRRFWWAAAGAKRRRGALGVFCALAGSLLLVGSGCGPEVEIERRPVRHAGGHFQGLVVGSEPDGAFVVAQHELAPEDDEVVVVSLADDEQRTCSLGRAFFYHTPGYTRAPAGDGNPRPARILTLEGVGAESGDLRIFDTSCVELMRVPSVEAPVEAIDSWNLEAYGARTTSGEVVKIDPWAGSVQTIAANASFWKFKGDKFWLVEGGSLVVRDLDGKILQTAGEGVTEVAVSLWGEEAAYVDTKGLWVMKPGDPGPIAVPTTAAPCKPVYAFENSPQRLTYRDDCAAGVLGVLDRATGERRVFSTAVTYVFAFHDNSKSPWVFFEREEPGKEREFWAVPEAGEPVFVGTNPKPGWVVGPTKDIVINLDYDGATSTLGKWSPEGGFSPLLEGFWEPWEGVTDGHFPMITDPQEELGTLVVLDSVTLAEALRVPGIRREKRRHFQKMRVLQEVELHVLDYVHDWDHTLGAGTLTTWIPETGEQIDIDTGVSESSPVVWPEHGIVYAVRTPERAGLWTAYPYPDL
ncbi:hypothetical protein [Polyangium sp. y55x31]|uniref:hypothetical protein n=1 Tax=Polyangium sp. y55x31 TaxID=3042688 RepID=UPI002482B5AB|nr:hypothetical protein [Polyangium sp. y55x31]MDI1477898.1 hypothetical protein [Polyangium sp. y55x31]